VRLFHGLAKIHAPSTLGSFLRSFTRGNVWLAEAVTSHVGYGKHDLPGGAAAGAAEDHDGQGSVPELGAIGSPSAWRGRAVAWWDKDLN